MQKISSFHRFILEIQQILDSQDLKGPHGKIIKVTFDYPEILSTHQKSFYSIDSFLGCSQF